MLDYLHADQVHATLVPRDEQAVGTLAVEQEREISLDGRFVRKTITLGELGRTFVERVRLFEPAELVAMASVTSPRVILFARRQ